MNSSRPWDIFCRVIDNFGDIGVCWRLAADLASRGITVRLWVDDPDALRWMAPQGRTGVEVKRWPVGESRDISECPEPGAAVIEAFGCDLPESFIAAMDRQRAEGKPPIWLNLEYLSAEAYVERCHLLPSPQWRAPANGLMKWFFYPGFTPATGGLLREPGLLARMERVAQAVAVSDSTSDFTHDSTSASVTSSDTQPKPDDLLASLGVQRRTGERIISLFCYDNAPVASLLQAIEQPDLPVLILLTPGKAKAAWSAADMRQRLPAHWRVMELPWLSQQAFDELLAACDLNFVRGEDSFVRAQWAGKPFVWHIYAQVDGVHADKLAAFLNRHLASVAPDMAEAVRLWTEHWNGLAQLPPQPLPDLVSWRLHARRWRNELAVQPDLVTQLLSFVTARS